MHLFKYFIRLYDKNGSCIFVSGFDSLDSAMARYDELREETNSDSWIIELSTTLEHSVGKEVR